ncbi:MAG TPA: outer membrane lipoprotein carrier protein LolA [Verrucomicrobiae bacterium]|nr:outer membrane lipoprotein carrier protein LolA [Verrucomicrobiae bacterium]
MKITTLLLGVLLAVKAVAATNEVAPAAAGSQAVLQDLQHKMASVKTVYLEFTQERVLKLFSDPLKSDGVMLIARPDEIRWETTAPYQSILLGDQKTVAQFEFSDGKWEKLKLGFPQLLQRIMQQMALMNQGKLDALMVDYTITVTTGDMTVLTMVPKDATVRGMMSSLEVHLLPDLSATKQVVMNEPNGDLTRITFHNEKRDVEFPAKTFDQSKPLDIAAVQTAVHNAP